MAENRMDEGVNTGASGTMDNGMKAGPAGIRSLPDPGQYQRTIFLHHQRQGGGYIGDAAAPVLLRMTRRFVKNPVLDAGAGSGTLLRELSAAGFTARGVDLTPAAPDVIPASLTALPFSGGSFGTVFACDVLEHLRDEELNAGLDELARVLRPGGHLIITVPHEEELSRNRIACPRCGHEFHRYGHWQSFDVPAVREWFGKRGMKTVLLKIYAPGVVAKLPGGRWLHFFLKKTRFEWIGRSIAAVARKGSVPSG